MFLVGGQSRYLGFATGSRTTLVLIPDVWITTTTTKCIVVITIQFVVFCPWLWSTFIKWSHFRVLGANDANFHPDVAIDFLVSLVPASVMWKPIKNYFRTWSQMSFGRQKFDFLLYIQNWLRKMMYCLIFKDWCPGDHCFSLDLSHWENRQTSVYIWQPSSTDLCSTHWKEKWSGAAE